MDLAKALRKAIADSGMSANQIAKKSGIGQTVISRFLNGADITISRAAKIMAALTPELRKAIFDDLNIKPSIPLSKRKGKQ